MIGWLLFRVSRLGWCGFMNCGFCFNSVGLVFFIKCFLGCCWLLLTSLRLSCFLVVGGFVVGFVV